jgi:hypothetical protein
MKCNTKHIYLDNLDTLEGWSTSELLKEYWNRVLIKKTLGQPRYYLIDVVRKTWKGRNRMRFWFWKSEMMDSSVKFLCNCGSELTYNIYDSLVVTLT